MNNKGFTLIEVIVTIALLAVISVISFVSVTKVIEDSHVKDCESLIKNINSAVKEYVSDNRYGTIETEITLKDLVDNNYLSGPIYNPFTDTEINSSSISLEIYLNDDYTFNKVDIKNSSDIIIDCNNKDTFG